MGHESTIIDIKGFTVNGYSDEEYGRFSAISFMFNEDKESWDDDLEPEEIQETLPLWDALKALKNSTELYIGWEDAVSAGGRGIVGWLIKQDVEPPTIEELNRLEDVLNHIGKFKNVKTILADRITVYG